MLLPTSLSGVGAIFPLLFLCFSAAASPAIPLLSGAGNFLAAPRKINGLAQGSARDQPLFSQISSVFPVEQRNQRAAGLPSPDPSRLRIPLPARADRRVSF